MIKKKDTNQEDKKTWEDYIKNPFDIYDKDQAFSNNLKRKKRFKFDLHGFGLDEANKKVKELILDCVEKNYKELLLITGKGIHSTNDKDTYVSKDLGKLKFSVPYFIKTDSQVNELILSVDEAATKDGGKGAILIKLKNL